MKATITGGYYKGWPPLHLAALLGHQTTVRALITSGAQVKATDGDGRTPLHWAAMYGHKEIAEYLIAQGADVNAKDKWDWTPLHRAARWGKTDVAELLIEKGADPNIKNNKDEIFQLNPEKSIGIILPSLSMKILP